MMLLESCAYACAVMCRCHFLDSWQPEIRKLKSAQSEQQPEWIRVDWPESANSSPSGKTKEAEKHLADILQHKPDSSGVSVFYCGAVQPEAFLPWAPLSVPLYPGRAEQSRAGQAVSQALLPFSFRKLFNLVCSLLIRFVRFVGERSFNIFIFSRLYSYLFS